MKPINRRTCQVSKKASVKNTCLSDQNLSPNIAVLSSHGARCELNQLH